MTNESGCSALFLSVDEESSMKETAPFYVYEVRIHHISNLRRTLGGGARRYARKEEGPPDPAEKEEVMMDDFSNPFVFRVLCSHEIIDRRKEREEISH